MEKSGEIKPGDLLYWDFEGDDIIDHATMITDIDKNGYLKYSGHTVDQYNADVYEGLNDFSNVKLHIVKMKDKFQVR